MITTASSVNTGDGTTLNSEGIENYMRQYHVEKLKDLIGAVR